MWWKRRKSRRSRRRRKGKKRGKRIHSVPPKVSPHLSLQENPPSVRLEDVPRDKRKFSNFKELDKKGNEKKGGAHSELVSDSKQVHDISQRPCP